MSFRTPVLAVIVFGHRIQFAVIRQPSYTASGRFLIIYMYIYEYIYRGAKLCAIRLVLLALVRTVHNNHECGHRINAVRRRMPLRFE